MAETGEGEISSIEPDDALNMEHGRKLFLRPCQFVAGAMTEPQLPQMNLPEIAFAGRSNVDGAQDYKVGDRVRVRDDWVSGHVRLPAYVRGKSGEVVGCSPPYPFPDAHAHGIEAAPEPTFDVRFRAEDLWPDSSDAAYVHVAIFRSYLRPEG